MVVSSAHPRVCGENLVQVQNLPRQTGSSPRVRGKPVKAARNAWNGRLIPACAGKTPWPPPVRFLPRAHPRVCGENRVETEAMSALEGSSPRVRGKPVSDLAQAGNQGLIPACAGKT